MSKDKKKRTIINLDNTIDYTKEPIFFGEDLNLQRYDKFRYEKIFKLFKTQLGFFWRPEEVNIGGKERTDFESLTDHQKFIFTKNLGYQILLDSVQGRGIKNLTEHLSSPESEAFCNSWEFSETIHSYSYTYIIKNIYSSAGDIFDNILNDPEIIKRTKSVTEYYDSLINSISDDSEDEKKKKLYLTLMSINILEGIRFYVSFACSYSFAENKKMEGNAKIISLINRDENLHLGFTQTVLRLMKDEKSEGFQHIVKECEPIVTKMFEDAANEEMEWADYLFEGGSMLGLNADILKKYMKYLTNKRMKALKLEPIFESTSNPISWIDHWTESKSIQVAPQESEIESYVIGSFDQDLDDSDFGDFEI
jgi:ribonucleoside-diphosphate reductase beta chain